MSAAHSLLIINLESNWCSFNSFKSIMESKRHTHLIIEYRQCFLIFRQLTWDYHWIEILRERLHHLQESNELNSYLCNDLWFPSRLVAVWIRGGKLNAEMWEIILKLVKAAIWQKLLECSSTAYKCVVKTYRTMFLLWNLVTSQPQTFTCMQ